MFEQVRKRLARWLAPPRAPQQRSYLNAQASRLTSWPTSNTSSDAELIGSLTSLRSRSRSLIRDASYAKRARTVVVNNVIGAGIGMQAQVKTTRDALNTRVNDEIESLWERWGEADSCHTGGRLAFPDLERALMAQIFDAGEVFVRKRMSAFGSSPVPLTLELIEAERIADDLSSVTYVLPPGHQIRMGVEVDTFYRPVAYFIRLRHPVELNWSNDAQHVERVPADQIIHLALIDRWPQTRGEPWMHTSIRRLNDMDGYSDAEITRARTQACTVGAIQTPEDSTSFGDAQPDGTAEMNLEPGTIQRLNPGEVLNTQSPSSPNPALDPFMRYMLREVAAGTGISYESISRDYSQSNYSSSRLALLEDRDLWKVFQSWFIRSFRAPVHRVWLQQAVLSSALSTIALGAYGSNPATFEAVRFKPRGWSWVDPTSEVEAYSKAVTAGFTTVGDVIANTADGRDLEDVINERRQELDQMKAKNLVFDTDPVVYTAASEKDLGLGAKAEADAKALEKGTVAPTSPTAAEPARAVAAITHIGRQA